MEILIISGLSGAGKSKAASYLEDMGFYIVDNMPAGMMLKFAEFCAGGVGGRYNRVALVYDVRTAESETELSDVLAKFRTMKVSCRLLFLEASPETIIHRYKETRRLHPLRRSGGTLEEAVRRERRIMEPVRQQADWVIDTSYLSTAQLRGELLRIFDSQGEKGGMSVSVSSFGYKYGLPLEADLVLDVRFPHRMAGEEECLLEQYLIIARSVTHAQRMERELRRLGIRAAVFHAPLELTAGRGCAYALAVAPAAIRAALQAIDGMRLRPAAIFFQDGNGYREVAL